MYSSFPVLMLSWTFLSFVFGKCPPDDLSKVIEYVAIPEDQYDRNFSSITDTGTRPLGFDKAIWYTNEREENPCVKITGAEQRRIEIMFETYPSARLCVNTQSTTVGCSDAGTGSFYDCRLASNGTLYLEFFCDQGEEYDVRFWYRVVLGKLPADDPEGYWCDNRDQDQYPASLRQLPSNFPYNPPTTRSPDTGLTALPCSLLVFVLAGLVSLTYTGL
ncbi:hypothetical protein ElyMa_004061400 [Elysia marginata]|uniref:Uncharacterized protein n=1 Tax=Elysia marginata TaxID=1093978 RepID=A0AAV4G743_9GAST|nr:hypothetical protein ElyMa_004061400 [Elysia marginata]